MNKEEAIRAMQEGKKVTHTLFFPNEWMTMKDGLIHLEDGVICRPDYYWFSRRGAIWNDGYSLFNE